VVFWLEKLAIVSSSSKIKYVCLIEQLLNGLLLAVSGQMVKFAVLHLGYWCM